MDEWVLVSSEDFAGGVIDPDGVNFECKDSWLIVKPNKD